jgi:putative oxidoreductase
MKWRDLLVEPSVRPGNWAALPLRLMVGLVFVFYGFDKLFNNNTIFYMGPDFFRALGIPFPEVNVVMIGALEFFGGLALMAGSFTKLFAFMMFGNMAVAMLTAGNYYFEGPLGFISLALVLSGAGPLSLDRILSTQPRLPRPLRTFFAAMADPWPRPVGWAATPLRLIMGLIFVASGMTRAFSAGATELNMVLGIVAALGGVALLAGVLTKPFALVLLVIALFDLFTAGFNTGNLLTLVTNLFTPGTWIVALLGIILLGPGPLSVDYASSAALRSRSDMSTADPAVDYGA